MALLFMTDLVVAAPINPQVLHAFCKGCTHEQEPFGSGAQDVVAGPDGAYYGTTAFSNTIFDENGNIDAGGSVYRADPAIHNVRVLYQFPRGYYPAPWLKAGADGYIYGGYVHSLNANSDWQSEGLFRISPTGEFTIIHDETNYAGLACNAPVQDSLGNWIGVISNRSEKKNSNIIYKITPAGGFKILHTLVDGQYFDCPNFEPVLAADGNLYGIIRGDTNRNTPDAIYRLAPDGTFTILRTFDQQADGHPATSLTIGPDGALYGELYPPINGTYTMYRMSLEGQFVNLGPVALAMSQKLTLMPDGYFYGTSSSGCVLFRLSPAGDLLQLYAPLVPSSIQFCELTRGFDDALYGTGFNGGKRDGGVFFRYVPPPVP